MSSLSVAIIGGGNMGRALIGGLLRHGVPPTAIHVGESSAAARQSLEREFGVPASPDNASALAGASAAVFAVKPQDARAVIAALRPALAANAPLVVSIAAGITVQALEAWCPPEVRVVRAMPNRPANVGVGASALYAPEGVGASDRALAERIMSAVGSVVWLSAESDLDVVTALSGSGPAYFFLLAELMMGAAVRLGLDPQAARTLAVETLHGAGALAHSGDGDLARMRADVTSRGGTTEAALRVFTEAGLARIVDEAVGAAARRSRELAAQFGGADPGAAR